MGLSGGMDSSTLLGYLLEEGFDVHCCLFQYGSKHSAYEGRSALAVAQYYAQNGYSANIHLQEFDLRQVMSQFHSALLLSGGAIPEGHYNDESMKKTVVPGRNLIFISVMAGLAESIDAQYVALGIHAGDHHIYPDCRPEFISAANATVYRSTEGKVHVSSPFAHMNKKTILQLGYSLHIKVPYGLTRTCYKNQSVACGKCGSCQERLEAFKLLDITDPIQYETIPNEH